MNSFLGLVLALQMAMTQHIQYDPIIVEQPVPTFITEMLRYLNRVDSQHHLHCAESWDGRGHCFLIADWSVDNQLEWDAMVIQRTTGEFYLPQWPKLPIPKELQ